MSSPLLYILLCLTLSGCTNKYEVDLPIGDGNVEGDNVTCHYEINDSVTDDHLLKGYFTAEADADLDGAFVLSISFDQRYSSSFQETVLFRFEGREITAAKDGKLAFEINLGTLKNLFEETDSPKAFAFHFHREDAKVTDITSWSESSYTYTFDGTIVILYK